VFRNPATDIIVVLVVLLIIFGPKRLPEIGKGLGKGIQEFKSSIGSNSDSEESESEGERPAIGAGSGSGAAAGEKPAVSATEREQ